MLFFILFLLTVKGKAKKQTSRYLIGISLQKIEKLPIEKLNVTEEATNNQCTEERNKKTEEEED